MDEANALHDALGRGCYPPQVISRSGGTAVSTMLMGDILTDKQIGASDHSRTIHWRSSNWSKASASSSCNRPSKVRISQRSPRKRTLGVIGENSRTQVEPMIAKARATNGPVVWSCRRRQDSRCRRRYLGAQRKVSVFMLKAVPMGVRRIMISRESISSGDYRTP